MTEETNIIELVVKHNDVSFSSEVDDLVWEKDITYMEALTEVMQKYNYEPEQIPKLMTPLLKNNIKEEAERLSLIKKENQIRFD